MPPSTPRQSTNIHSRSLAYLALVAGVFCISFSGIFGKLANAPGDVVGAWRFTIAGLFLTGPAAINWRRGRAYLPRRALWMVLAGGLTFAADAFLWNTALRMTNVANASLLANTAPIWVGLGAWLLLRERLHPTYWLGLAIAITGVTLVMGLDALRGVQQINPGDLIAVLSGTTYAAYQLITKRAREQVDNVSYVWGFTIVAAVALVTVTQALEHPMMGLPLHSYLALLGLALVTHTGGWLLATYAFGHLPASLLTITLLGQAVVAAVLASLLLGETLALLQVVGGLVTLTGIYVVHRSTAGAGKDPAPLPEVQPTTPPL